MGPYRLDMDKRCKRCGEVKPLDEFYRHDGCRDGVRPECKRCNLAEKAERHRRNPHPARDRTSRWREDHPDRYRENQERFKATGAKAISNRRSYLKRKYGITLEQYDELLSEQGGVCGICGREPNPNISLHVDHDHQTGALRGLLCFPCNQAIGSLREDPALLELAIDYLRRHDPEIARLAALARARVAALSRPAWE